MKFEQSNAHAENAVVFLSRVRILFVVLINTYFILPRCHFLQRDFIYSFSCFAIVNLSHSHFSHFYDNIFLNLDVYS